MDFQSAAMLLRKQTITLENCERIIAALEKEMSSLQEQLLMSAIENNQPRHLRLLLRISVTEGVHKMFKQYSTNKLTQKQNITKSIQSQFESQDDDDESMTPLMATSSMVSITPDKAADQWSTFYCRLSRQE